MKTSLTSLALMFAALPAMAQQSAQFTMSLDGSNIVERVSGQKYMVNSQLPPFTVQGIDGDALRFDGYSNFIKAALPAGISTETMTVSVLLAPETYPMMNVNEAENTPTYATICGNLEDGGKKGFAFQLSSQGDVRFAYGSAYSGGYATTVFGTKKMPRGQWSRLTAVYDKGANSVTLYLNGEQIGTGRTNRMDLNPSAGTFWIGKDATDLKAWGMNINTFCGLIDDISIYNAALTADQVAALPQTGEVGGGRPDFSYPASRYASSLWRPQFHGMPSGGWTNECHGMTYSDGKYHVFFQKNANGPYMARLHWGHISSEDLCSWTEEPIAVAPAEKYDIKGCWSGCVYSDPTLTGGMPHILYTAVDNAKATICEASPVDETLVDWTKSDKNPIINGRPAGLSDDFRDPYFFSVGDRKYIIVGTSKNGLGACTLHEYVAGKWTNDGKIFFQAGNAQTQGTFWEMPNVTPLGPSSNGGGQEGAGKFLFTCTPLGTGMGVRTICWVGTISPDGKFTPTSDMQYLEMGGISRDGYGLLSPTIYQHAGKTLLLGIVPDKLPTDVNARMGWAHNYSLPRELSVAADGSLVQRPYSGLAAMRTEKNFTTTTTLDGTQSLDPVSGRHFEVIGDFTVGEGTVGFNFLKSNSGQATLTYNPAVGNLTLDLRSLSRTVNDNVFAGVYSAALPKKVAAGEHLKLHVFFDGSIADVFVNDTWAYSVRIYPNDANSVGIEAFATTPTAATISAWVLNATEHAPMEGISQLSSPSSSSCLYDLSGRQLSHQPAHGFCIVDGKKVICK